MTTNKKPSILYVDDERSNLEAFTASYRRYYDIHTANSAKEAINILNNNKIELIITDQRMPEMTGVQFLEAVVPTHANSIRMILTGFTDVDAIIKAINNGLILRYITKPWDEMELKNIIDVGIQIYRQEQKNQNLLEELKTLTVKQEETIGVFQCFVPKTVIDAVMLENEDELLAKAEERVISILFVDMHAFTSLSEKLQSKALLDFLSAFFSMVIDIVTRHEGHVYKIMGDGLLIIFGAPVSTMYNQENAANAALEIVKNLPAFNEQHAQKMNFETNVGISITTGDALVGHNVSRHYISYSVLGDIIHRAFRIEELTRGMSNTILVDEPSYTFLKDEFKFETSDTLKLESNEKRIYKLVSTHEKSATPQAENNRSTDKTS